MQPFQNIISSLILAIGFVAAAIVGGMVLKDIKMADRYVTVRGLAEKDMKADLGVWTLKFKSTSNELTAAHENLKAQQEKVRQFLVSKGFEEAEIQPTAVQVFDRKAQQYGNDSGALERYILQGGLRVRTDKVDVLDSMAQATSDLVGQGISLGTENVCEGVPSYMFTKLNDVKPEMMADATKNAREAAEQFAKDANANVGTIRNATQGYFSISARDNVEGASGNECGDQASLNKRVRVVTTVEYYLE
jgi:hypothetical protein